MSSWQITKIRRPWGHEVWHVNNELYCLKSLVMYPTGAIGVPVHLHYEKDEVIIFPWYHETPGTIEVRQLPDKVDHTFITWLERPGDQVRIGPGTFHSMRYHPPIDEDDEPVKLVPDFELLEVSTPHSEEDVFFPDDEWHWRPLSQQWEKARVVNQDRENILGDK